VAFVTGTANSFADLLAAVQNACTANGYVLTGSVLSKGTLFAEVANIAQTYPRLGVQCGTTQAAGVLSGRSDVGKATLGFATTGATLGVNPFSFPMTYNIHILTNPDEVYLVVNYGITMYQYIAFGQSTTAGLTGSGNWYAGSDVALNDQKSSMDVRAQGGYMQSSGTMNAGLFQGLVGYPPSQNGAIDHKLDSATWAVEGAWRDAFTLMQNSPNAWNGEAPLIPVTVYASRPSTLVSCVAELGHARFVMIDNLNDQQIITLGADKWKVYPWWKRSARGNTLTNTPGTGTFGHAIRYDGP